MGTRHNKARESPLPTYVGLTVHARPRKRELVETLFDLGLSISYDRVMAVFTAMGNRVCKLFHREQVVCPPNLRHRLFTTSAIDNIDHNPSSTTATDSFHGTRILFFQYPTAQIPGTYRREHRLLEEIAPSKRLAQLPESYTSAQKDVSLPEVDGPLRGVGQAIKQGLLEEARLVT